MKLFIIVSKRIIIEEEPMNGQNGAVVWLETDQFKSWSLSVKIVCFKT